LTLTCMLRSSLPLIVQFRPGRPDCALT
jgi:hypothetical protein